MSAHYQIRPLRAAHHREQLRTIREAIDADCPLSPVMKIVEALADDPLALSALELDGVAELLAMLAGYADAWFDSADEQAFGNSVDAAMARAADDRIIAFRRPAWSDHIHGDGGAA